MAHPLTIAYQPFATNWLGHTSRLIAIAQGIRRRMPDARQLFIVEGSSGQLLESAGFPHVSLPAEAAWAGPEWSSWPTTERDRMLGAICRTVLEELKPRLMVFDSRPCTYMVEQAASLKLPTVFVARRVRHDVRTFEWALAHESDIDLVIVPHDPGSLPVPAALAERTHFVGTIVRDRVARGMDGVSGTAKRILITGGGGGFPGTVDFYNQALAAAHAARARLPSLELTLVTGPMFKEWEKLKSMEGVAMVPFIPDMVGAMAQASVIICQAGYNTIAETEGIGVPTICVPAPRVADDQFARARGLVGQREAFFVLTEFTVEMLRDQIIQCLEIPRADSSTSAPPAGADRAAELILNLCG